MQICGNGKIPKPEVMSKMCGVCLTGRGGESVLPMQAAKSCGVTVAVAVAVVSVLVVDDVW